MEKHIYLIGFMAAGKSTVGKLLAEKLGVDYLDSDVWIEQQNGLTVMELFEKKGEEFFRQEEKRFIEWTATVPAAVIGTGGGLPIFNNLIGKMRELGDVAYLNVSLPTITNRLMRSAETRPLVKGMNEIELKRFVNDTLMERTGVYKMAHWYIPNESNNPELAVEDLIKRSGC